jgi:predicted phosphodiesterase
MRYAIISDIHANLEALRAVLKDIKAQRVDKVVCLGDIVGYYTDPNHCSELCRKSKFICIRGNHDDAALEICDTDDFNPVTQKALLWTAKELKEENKDWLRTLPEHLLVDDQFLAVHGAPWDPYAYIFTSGGALRAFSYLHNNHPSINLCFFGHTHQRALYTSEENAIQEVVNGTHYTLSDQGIFLINPGSVGQSRDGIPGASYIIYNSTEQEIEFIRVPYNIARTQHKVAAAKLPMVLAERLSEGH